MPGSGAGDNDGADAGNLHVPLIEEAAGVEKRQVLRGKTRIRTVTDTVEQIASATLDEDHVEVVRIPVNRVVSEAPTIRTEDGVTIIPVLEEVLVVEKQLLLREELHIRRCITTETVHIPISLQKQRATVERSDGAGLTYNDEESDT